MATTMDEATERKLVKKYGLAPCPTMGAAGIHTRAMVAIDTTGTKRRLVRYCPDCHHVWPASGSVADHPTAQPFDFVAAASRATDVQDAIDRRNDGLKQRYAIRKASKPAVDADWFAWYSEYLRTPGWRARRMAVLDRDGNRCQAGLDGCTQRATEVHHRSYDMMRQGDMDAHQPLYDLVSICHSCHARITELERGQRRK